MLPIRAAIKSLRRSPGFAAVATLSLALALGLVAAVFGMIDGIRNPRTATRDPEQLFRVSMRGTGASGTVTAADHIDVVRRFATSAEQIAFETYGMGDVLLARDLRVEANGARVSANFFDVRGVKPVAGRVFGEATADEDAVGSVVISERIWKTAFDRESRLDRLSVSIESNEETRRMQVVGIVSVELAAETGEDYWLALPRDIRAFAATRSNLTALVRLRPGATLDTLTAQLAAAASYMKGLHGEDRRAFGYGKMAVARDPLKINDFEWLLMGAALAVLVIACSNLANLVLARGLARQRDMAVRVSLGARRRDIITGVLAECLVIALAGAALGILAATWGFSLLRASMPERLPTGALVIAMSWRVIAISSAMAAVAALAFGLLPALRLSAIHLSNHIKDNSGTTTGRRRNRFPALVIGQVALSLAMLTGVSLLLRASREVRKFDFGFDTSRLLSVTVHSRIRADTADNVRLALWSAAETRLRQYPAAEAVAWTSSVGLARSPAITGERSGNAFRTLQLMSYQFVSPNFLRTTGTEIIRGRDFEDHEAFGEGVVVIDSGTALRIWGSEDPIGKLVKFALPERISPWFRVVGISRSTRSMMPRHDGEEAAASVYVVGKEAFSKPFSEPGIKPLRAFVPHRAFVVRAKPRDIATLRNEIPRTMQDILPARGTVRVYGFDDVRREMIEGQRFLARIFGIFGSMSLALCALGLYSVLSHTVSLRMREVGIRLALGATNRRVFLDVLHEGAILVVAGTAVGGLVTIWSNKLVDPYIGIIYHIDAWALVAAESVLVGVAMLAMLRPALRATKTDPVEVLRAS
jgi:putative ABC transport system permease protein